MVSCFVRLTHCRLPTLPSARRHGQLGPLGSPSRSPQRVHTHDAYDSDGIDDASSYSSYSGARSRVGFLGADGLGDPSDEAMMDRALKQGQDQILKSRRVGYQSPQISASKPRSPQRALKIGSHDPTSLRIGNRRNSFQDPQGRRESDLVESTASKVKISRSDNKTIPDKKAHLPNLFPSSEEDEHGVVDLKQLRGPLPSTNKSYSAPITGNGTSPASPMDRKPDLQLDTAAVPQTQAPVSLDKVSAYTDTSPDSASTNQNHNNKRPLELDYDSPVLATMSLKNLQNEPYDHDPRAEPFEFSTFFDHVPPDATITTVPEKLEKLSSQSRRDDRIPFFQSITMTEWEECGDWLIERFATLMSQLKDGRKARRQLAYRYEEEIRMQHDKIVGERNEVEEMIQGMRTGGRGVLQRSSSAK